MGGFQKALCSIFNFSAQLVGGVIAQAVGQDFVSAQQTSGAAADYVTTRLSLALGS